MWWITWRASVRYAVDDVASTGTICGSGRTTHPSKARRIIFTPPSLHMHASVHMHAPDVIFGMVPQSITYRMTESFLESSFLSASAMSGGQGLRLVHYECVRVHLYTFIKQSG